MFVTMNASASILGLPRDVVLIVFASLARRDVCMLRLVCKHMCALASAVVHNVHVPVSVPVLRAFSHLRCLRLRSHAECELLTSLKMPTLVSVMIAEECLSMDLSTVLTVCPNVTQLTIGSAKRLARCVVRDPGGANMAAQLQALRVR